MTNQTVEELTISDWKIVTRTLCAEIENLKKQIENQDKAAVRGVSDSIQEKNSLKEKLEFAERDLAAARAEVETLKARIRELEARPAATTPREDAGKRIEAALDKLNIKSDDRLAFCSPGHMTTFVGFDELTNKLAAEFPDTIQSPHVTREKLIQATLDTFQGSMWTYHRVETYAKGICNRLGLVEKDTQ